MSNTFSPRHLVRPRLRRVLVVSSVVVATMGGGIAFAAWTSSGTGSAAAQAGAAAPPTTGAVDGSAFTTGLLYPGGPAGTVKVLVNNPNPYSVLVAGVAAGTGAVTGSGGTGSCVTTGVTFTAQSLSSNNAVPANGSATLTLPGAVSMSTASDNGCQNAEFSIPVTITVVSG